MIDRDLANLYGVSVPSLNQAVARNSERFPAGFMFRLTRPEAEELVAAQPRLNSLKHSRTTPNAFTEFGVAMLSSVLKSDRAVRINIRIIQSFIRLRQLAQEEPGLSKRLRGLEQRMDVQDERVDQIIEAMGRFTTSEESEVRKIGFNPDEG